MTHLVVVEASSFLPPALVWSSKERNASVRPSHTGEVYIPFTENKMYCYSLSPLPFAASYYLPPPFTLIKKKIKLSSYIIKFRKEQLQSHIGLTPSSYMGKLFAHFLIY
jgi:hypothetical protein